ncbi:MAG: Bax inhibitor-1/YccA family protein [Microlunatus sp.]
MLRSSNPILSKQDAFTPAAPQYGQQQYGQNPYAQTDPYAQQGYAPYGQPPVSAEPRMTFDDVITKTAVVMGVLVISAALAWLLVPVSLYMPALILSALVGFGVVLVVSFRRKISPPLVFAYAAIEGIFIGMFSKIFELMYSGIVMQAVIGTFAAAGVTLAAYKFFNIRVTPKFQKIVIIATISFAVAALINFVAALLGFDLGLRDGGTGPVSLLAIGFSLLGAVLAVLNLVLDFDYIEKGVAMGAPASESWRGAFGLTVTMVWLYIEILRLLSYLRR